MVNVQSKYLDVGAVVQRFNGFLLQFNDTEVGLQFLKNIYFSLLNGTFLRSI